MSLQVNHMPVNPGNIIDPAKKAEALPGFAALLSAGGIMPEQSKDAQSVKNLVNVAAQQQPEQHDSRLISESQDNSVVDNQWLMFNLAQAPSDETETAAENGLVETIIHSTATVTAGAATNLILSSPVAAEQIDTEAQVENVLPYAVDGSTHPIVDATIPILVNIQFDPAVLVPLDIAQIDSQQLLGQQNRLANPLDDVVQQAEQLLQINSFAGPLEPSQMLADPTQLNEAAPLALSLPQTATSEQAQTSPILPEQMLQVTPGSMMLLNLANPQMVPTIDLDTPEAAINKPNLAQLPTTAPVTPITQTLFPVELIAVQTVNEGVTATQTQSSGSSQVTLQLVMWSAIASGNLSQAYSENSVSMPLSFGIGSYDLRGQSRILSTAKFTVANQQQIALESTFKSQAQLSEPAKLKQEMLKNRNAAVAAKHSANLFQSVIMPQKVTWSEQLQKLWVRDYFMSEQQQQALIETVNKGFAENQQVRTLVLNGRTVIQSGGNR